jgi:L-aspartate oxidase
MRASTPIHRSRYLVLGSGLAGLYFALEVADRGTVTILTKHNAESSNTRWAQGGISAVFAGDDSSAEHVEDTLVVGAGLCDRDMVMHAVQEGPALVRRLAERYGVRFDRSAATRAPPSSSAARAAIHGDGSCITAT